MTKSKSKTPAKKKPVTKPGAEKAKASASGCTKKAAKVVARVADVAAGKTLASFPAAASQEANARVAAQPKEKATARKPSTRCDRTTCGPST